MTESNEKLHQIRELIKSGKRKQAVSMLTVMIERDHDNPELWWLLANAVEDPDQAKLALDELLALRPDDQRAQKMLNRLETRQLLTQMGFSKPQSAPRTNNNRVLVFGAFTAVVVLVVIAVALVALNNRDGDNIAQVLPTQRVLPTLTDTPPIDTPEPTLQPTEEPQQDITEDQTASELTVPDQVPSDQVPSDQVPSDQVPSEVTQEAMAPDTGSTTDFGVIPQPEVTLEVLPPGTADETLPQNEGDIPVEDPIVPDEPLDNQPLPEPDDTLDIARGEGTIQDRLNQLNSVTQADGSSRPPPESTADVTAPDFTVPGTDFIIETPSIAPMPTPKPVTVRGQILDRQPKQELIKPYSEHGWTFSGYRDEEITLELLNITGKGNPSLELRNANDEVIASDIELTNGSNRDATISIMLPADGVYTVVVRMAAVNEQLYHLVMKRG